MKLSLTSGVVIVLGVVVLIVAYGSLFAQACISSRRRSNRSPRL